MLLNRYFIYLLLLIILSWLVFISVLLYIDPFVVGILGVIVFYVSLGMALVGSFTLIGFFIRLNTQDITTDQAHAVSIRQALFFTVIILYILILQQNHILTTQNVLIFIAVMTLLELGIIIFKKQD